MVPHFITVESNHDGNCLLRACRVRIECQNTILRPADPRTHKVDMARTQITFSNREIQNTALASLATLALEEEKDVALSVEVKLAKTVLFIKKAMSLHDFIARYSNVILAVLSGFDRLLLK